MGLLPDPPGGLQGRKQSARRLSSSSGTGPRGNWLRLRCPHVYEKLLEKQRLEIECVISRELVMGQQSANERSSTSRPLVTCTGCLVGDFQADAADDE